MSAGTIAALLADLIAPEGPSLAPVPPANAANSANREHPCGPLADSVPCESLRTPANSGNAEPGAGQDSQAFATVRRGQNGPQSEQRGGLSQDSQLSQGSPEFTQSGGDLAAVAWTDADISAFLDRRARLMRWGWAEPEAERMAERLVRRDREHDDRVCCADCRHYRYRRCGNHERAGLCTFDIGRDLVAVLQRCAGFQGANPSAADQGASGCQSNDGAGGGEPHLPLC